MVRCDADVRGAPVDQGEHGRQDAPDGADFTAALVSRGWHSVEVAEELVRGVNQVDVQGSASAVESSSEAIKRSRPVT